MPTTYAIPDGRTVFAATTWTGVNTTAAITISNAVNGVSFKPDFVWEKPRSLSYTHSLSNSVVGTNIRLNSAGTTGDETNFLYGYTSSFNTDGFTASPGVTDNENWNTTGATFVAWQWKAGGTAVSNTSGTISSQVSANTTSGFSVVTYTGNGVASGTIGHGLGVTPQFFVFKQRNTASNWSVYHASIGNTGALRLNTTDATITSSGYWNNTSPTSSIITVGANLAGAVTDTFVIYAWAPIAGYSAFGSYTGNGSADGPFIYTGFRPRFVLIKRSTGVDNWWIHDTSMTPYNAMTNTLAPNLTDTDTTNAAFNNMDCVSNGFKLRSSYSGTNQSGETYIYACFAENPFKYANAR